MLFYIHIHPAYFQLFLLHFFIIQIIQGTKLIDLPGKSFIIDLGRFRYDILISLNSIQ